MTSAIEVIRQVQGKAPAEITLDAEVGLLGIGIDEVLALGIAERLKSHRQGSCRQIILVEKYRLGKVQRLELLLIRQVAKRSINRTKRRRSALGRVSRVDERPLENGNGIEVARVTCERAGPGAGKGQLAAARSVRRVTEKIQTQQRVIIEQSIRGANHRSSVTCRVPRQANSRLKIILVGLNAFLQSEEVVPSKRQSDRWLELGCNFHVVAQAVVEREIRPYAP